MDEMEHKFTDEIVCPYCGCIFNDSWEFEDDDGIILCEECGKEFNYTREINITYNTSKLPEYLKIEIEKIDCGNYILKPKKKVVFDCWYNYELNCYETNLGEFKHFVFGDSVEELKEMIKEDLKFMWEEFVMEYDENLDYSAMISKSKMLESFEKILK